MRKYLFLPFILLLFGIFTHAHAETQPAEMQYQVHDFGWFSTKVTSCDAAMGKQFAGMTINQATYQSGSCSIQANGWYNTVISIAEKYACPSTGGWTINSATPPMCSRPDCGIGETREADGSCVALPKCTPGEVVSSGLYDIGTSATNHVQQSICHRGCYVNFTGDSPVARALVGGKYHYYARGQYEKVGDSCSVPGDAPAGLGNTPSPTCGSGQTLTYGTGKPSCINTPGTGGGDPTPANPHTPDAPKPPEETKEEKQPPSTNPDGSTSQTTTTTYPDGSTKSETTTTKPDGSTSTTITTTPAAIDPTKTPDPMKDFCSTNPNNKLCKDTDERSWGRPDGVGKEFDIPTKDEEIEAKKDEFKQLLQQIRGEVQGLFNWSGAGGAGQLGCSGSVNILGANFQICLGQYSEQLSLIADGLVFLSLLLALFIILA